MRRNYRSAWSPCLVICFKTTDQTMSVQQSEAFCLKLGIWCSLFVGFFADARVFFPVFDRIKELHWFRAKWLCLESIDFAAKVLYLQIRGRLCPIMAQRSVRHCTCQRNSHFNFAAIQIIGDNTRTRQFNHIDDYSWKSCAYKTTNDMVRRCQAFLFTVIVVDQ